MLFTITSQLAQAAGFEILRTHRAVYDVELNNAEERSGIADLSGRIVYEITGNECEGISVRYRFKTLIRTATDQFVTDQQTATYESSDGSEFSFQTKSFVNDASDQVVTGTALRTDEAITVKIAKPNKRQIELETGLFTITHLTEIIAAAKRGESFVTHDVFDGSGDGDQVFRSVTVIGKGRDLADDFEGEGEAVSQAIAKPTAWPITMSYFSKKTGNNSEQLPVYEASFMLHEDGVTRELIMRYPDYSLKASLQHLEIFDDAPCKIEN